MFFIQFALEWIDFFFLIISSKQLSQYMIILMKHSLWNLMAKEKAHE